MSLSFLSRKFIPQMEDVTRRRLLQRAAIQHPSFKRAYSRALVFGLNSVIELLVRARQIGPGMRRIVDIGAPAGLSANEN